MGVYIGLDVGGTKFMVAAADETGKILRWTRADTPHEMQPGIDLRRQSNNMCREYLTFRDIVLQFG